MKIMLRDKFNNIIKLSYIFYNDIDIRIKSNSTMKIQKHFPAKID